MRLNRPFVGGRLARIFGAVGNGYEVEEADGGMAWHEKDIGMLGDWRLLVVLSKWYKLVQRLFMGSGYSFE